MPVLSHPPVFLHSPKLHLNISSVFSFNFPPILQGILCIWELLPVTAYQRKCFNKHKGWTEVFVLPCYSLQQMHVYWGNQVVFLIQESLEINLLSTSWQDKAASPGNNWNTCHKMKHRDRWHPDTQGWRKAAAGSYHSCNLCSCWVSDHVW